MKAKRMFVFSTIVLIMGATLTAGSLEPSGAPAPTMKTLDEVEPRIPINSDTAPGDANYEYIISNSGSYYLAGNVSTSKGGIRVNADDVTIDLMGYTFKGPDTGTNDGIYMNNRNNVEVRNGIVRDFHYGVNEEGGGGQSHRIVGVRVISNTVGGIHLQGSGHLVRGCTVKDNGRSATVTVYGIRTGRDSTVSDNRLNGNGNYATSPVYGIFAYNGGCRITGNVSNMNGFQATNAVYGIHGNYNSTIIGNTANSNGEKAPAVYGINAGEGCTVIGNTANENGYGTPNFVYGIYLEGYDLVDQNTAYNNGPAATVTNMTMGVTGCVYGNNVAP